MKVWFKTGGKMKPLLLTFLLLFSFDSSFAKSHKEYELSNIISIDDYDFPHNYVEVSEEGLPQNHYLQLIQLMASFRFTLLSEVKASDLFRELKKNPMARMRDPGGRCSYRRSYIQNLLKNRNIISGKLLISCPANNGRLRLRDRVSGRYYTFSNFHDSNIVAVKTNTGVDFRVMDLQFEDGPVSLHDFLTEIEFSQRIRPSKRRGTSSNLCYWTISTPHFSF